VKQLVSIKANQETDTLGQCYPTHGPLVTCGRRLISNGLPKLPIFFTNLCLQNELTDKAWHNICKFQHKPSSNDVLKCMVLNPNTV